MIINLLIIIQEKNMKKNKLKATIIFGLVCIMTFSMFIISYAAVTKTDSGYIGNTGVKATASISKTQASAKTVTTASKTSDLYVKISMKYKDSNGNAHEITSNWYTRNDKSFPKNYSPNGIGTGQVVWCDGYHKATYGGKTWNGYTTTK